MSWRMSPKQYAARIGEQGIGKTPPAPRSTEEADFQRRVLELAALPGWLSHHEDDSRRSTPGWPDIALAKPERPLIIAELKSRRGKVSVAQRGWLEVLGRSTGLEVCLWRPGDWPEIVELLQR
jgi:hypothetical protein